MGVSIRLAAATESGGGGFWLGIADGSLPGGWTGQLEGMTMRSRTLTEQIGDLGLEATARDVLNLAYVGVPSLEYQSYYDHDDVRVEVADVPSLVMIGTEPGVGDWAEFLDGSLVYFSALGEGRWRSWVDHTSCLTPYPE